MKTLNDRHEYAISLLRFNEACGMFLVTPLAIRGILILP